MSVLGHQSLINTRDAFWLSSISADVQHSTIQVQEIDAAIANISTANISTLNVDDLELTTLDVSGLVVSSIFGNTATLSTLNLISGDGVNPYLTFTTDPSGVRVQGCPIIFDDLVYLTSTINIVQVSTLVDTDLFASNGYFSSLSSGSFVAGDGNISSLVFNDMSGNTGSMKRLVVSSIIAGDISGVDLAQNWSLYPTLNSSIIFQSSYVLSNVGPSLYFAGVEITDVSGGGQDWSRFPAVSTVLMGDNSLTQLSTLQFQDGGKLYSVTGNNLFYNGQPISYGPGGAASNWAQYTANANVNIGNSTLFGVSLIQGSNMTLFGSNITNGNTFTGSLGVGGLSALPLASINSLGQGVLQDLDVGNTTTAIGDLNVYGNFALPGDNALYVIGGTTLTGGLTGGVPVHGTEIGAAPVAGIDTMRIDVLPVGIGINAATYIQLAAAGAGSFAAGGALSLAGGDYIEMNTDDLRVINTTSGNQSTTLTVANIQMPASVAATVPLQINNTAGGINLVGATGKGQIAGFSSIAGDNLIAGSSTITNTIYVPGTAYMGLAAWNNAVGVSTTIGALRVNNIQIPDNITGVTNAPMPLESRIENFSSIQSGAMSTGDIRLSSINGINWNDISGGGGGGGGNIFSTIQISTMFGVANNPYGSTINVDTGLQFIGSGGSGAQGHFISSLLFVNSTKEDVLFQFSTLSLSYTGGINPLGYVRIGGGGAFDAHFQDFGVGVGLSTTAVLCQSSISQVCEVSTLAASGGLPIKVNNTLEFISPNAVTNVDVINLNPPAIPQLTIGASTIVFDTNNVRTESLSTLNLSTSAFTFSTATSVGSNTDFNYPLVIDYDHANNISTAGVAISVQGHNYATGAVVNRIDIGARATGENFIMSSWPGSNLEDLYIDSTEVIFRDGTFSTIVNLDPYGLITTGAISAPSLLVSSINGTDARPAYTNNLMLSTMELYPASTTLMYWSTVTTSSNINTSGYDTVVGLNGVFKIGTSFQFLSAGSADEVEFFLLKNDNVIAQSGGIQSVQNNEEIVTYVEVLEPLVNGDKIQVGCFTNGTGVFVSTINGNVIQSPAVIMTMYRVDTV